MACNCFDSLSSASKGSAGCTSGMFFNSLPMDIFSPLPTEIKTSCRDYTMYSLSRTVANWFPLTWVERAKSRYELVGASF